MASHTTTSMPLEEKRKLSGKFLLEISFKIVDSTTIYQEIWQVDRIISPDQEDRSAIVTWKYDSGNREVECIEALGTPEDKITRTIYNSKGQKEKVIKPDGVQILHTYDIFGRLESYRSSDDSFHYIYKYDSRGNPVCVSDEIHRTRTLQTFDNENRLIQETLGNGLSLSYRYDAQGRPIELKLPDNTSVEYTYNGLDLENSPTC